MKWYIYSVESTGPYKDWVLPTKVCLQQTKSQKQEVEKEL